MKKLLFFVLLFPLSGFSQYNWELVDSTFIDSTFIGLAYKDAKTGYIKRVEYGIAPFKMMSQLTETENRKLIDTLFDYHDNGTLAGTYYYPTAGNLATFTYYDTCGKKYITGYLYQDIRVGTWDIFDTEGNVISWVKYAHKADGSDLDEEKIAAIKANDDLKIVDTLLRYSMYGFDYLYGATGLKSYTETWGEVIEHVVPDKLTAIMPNQYYSDGITGRYPISAFEAINEFSYFFNDKWGLELYSGCTLGDTLGINSLLIEAYHTTMVVKGNSPYMNIILFDKENEGKVRAYNLEQGHKAYTAGQKLEEGEYVYYMNSKSFFIEVNLFTYKPKADKAVVKFFPTLIRYLEEFSPNL